MARKDNTLSAIIRDLYDTASAAVMTKGPHDRTTGAHVCVVAHITAEELQTGPLRMRCRKRLCQPLPVGLCRAPKAAAIRGHGSTRRA